MSKIPLPGRLRRLAAALAITLSLLTLPVSPATAAGPVNIENVYTTQARYSPGATVPVVAQLSNASASGWTGSVALTVNHLDQPVGTSTQTVTLAAGERRAITLNWVAPSVDFQGYLATVSAAGNTAVTAIDVSSTWTKYPRYGYLTDYPVGQTAAQAQSQVDQLVRDYHLNALQFYDWMWRHENVIKKDATGAPLPSWQDWSGITISKQAVVDDITAAHQDNVAAMPYAMSYAGLQGYEQISGVSPTWGIFSDTLHQHQLNFDFGRNDPNLNMWLFNPADTNWQNYITGQYLDQVRLIGFDGVHLDQLGQRDTVYDYNGAAVNLQNTFSSLVNATKQRLTANDPAKAAATFNIVNGAVGGWAADDVTRNANQDFVYSEIWEKSPTYQSLKNFVSTARANAGRKAAVLAGYMNYGEDFGPRYEAPDATLYGVTVNNNHPGYTGRGFVDNFGKVGDYVEFTVNATEDRDYALVFRYSNATGATVSRAISVDGVNVGRVNCRNLPNWDTWDYDAYLVTHLSPGTHKVRMTADVGGYINLNNLVLGTFDETSVRLADAAFSAIGASHIELGQGNQMLAHPYFPNHYKQMSNSLKAAMRSHYNFITAYENLLFDAKPTDSGTQFVTVNGVRTSGDASANTVWTALTRTSDYDVMHLINLLGNGNTWRNSASTVPPTQSNLAVKYYLGPDATPSGVYLASPDVNGGTSQSLPFTTGVDTTGSYISFTLPSLQYWDMVYIKRGFTIPAGGLYEAELAIKTGVTTNTNHPGYTGPGFVDNFATVNSGVSFVVRAPVDGTYTLRFRYGNGGTNATRSLTIDGDFSSRPYFPGLGSWDTWSTVSPPVQLSAGLHTIVLWYQSADTGAINLDSMTVTAN